MIAMKQVPAEVLAELANEFAAGLPARVAVMREAVDEIAKQRSVDAAHRLRLAAHALAGTASARHAVVPGHGEPSFPTTSFARTTAVRPS